MASKLRAATRRILDPAMAELGFDLRYPHFLRKREDVLDLVSLLFDKWGGGFFLEFATHPSGDLETTWGEVVPEKNMDVAYTDPAVRARLLATRQHGDERLNYFRYDAIADDSQALNELVARLVSALPQMIDWLEDGSVGPNVAPFSTEQSPADNADSS